mmetsp:Transcript_15602/g.42765  ORF Transcript_15602/g.42765 Transcript_15602/m.42765 type:complete len:102 (+) Transcript_15602:296-601(+)
MHPLLAAAAAQPPPPPPWRLGFHTERIGPQLKVMMRYSIFSTPKSPGVAAGSERSDVDYMTIGRSPAGNSSRSIEKTRVGRFCRSLATSQSAPLTTICPRK